MSAAFTRLERQIEKQLAAEQISARAVVKWTSRGKASLASDQNFNEAFFGICGAWQVERPLVEITLAPRRRNRRQALKWCSSGTGASIVADVVRAGLGAHLAWMLVYEVPLGHGNEHLVTPSFGEARFDATRAADDRQLSKELNMAAEHHVDALTQARLRWLQAKGFIDPESSPHLWQEFTEFDVALTVRHVQPDDLITAKAWNHVVNRIAALERFGAGSDDSGISSESSAFRTGSKRRRSQDD